MSPALRPTLVARYRRWSGVLALAATAVGGTVMAGWLFGVPRLTDFYAPAPEAKFNAAVCLVLCGLSLWLQHAGPPAPRRRVAAGALAGAATLLALLTALEFIFGWDFGIDQLVVQASPGGLGALAPGRMAPITVGVFLLLGAALLLVDARTRRGHPPAPALGLAAMVAVFVEACGYVFGVEFFVGPGAGRYLWAAAPMVLGTALLAAGLLLARAESGPMARLASDGLGGSLARRLAPASVLVLLGVGALVVQAEAARVVNLELGLALFATVVAILIVALVLATAGVIDRVDAERQATEAARSTAERSFVAALDNLSLIALQLDLAGRAVYCNDYLLEVTGWSRHEVLGQDWFARFVPDAETVRAVFDRTFPSSTFPPHYENPIRTRGGQERLIAWNNSIVRDAAGAVAGTLSIGEDITVRKRAESITRGRLRLIEFAASHPLDALLQFTVDEVCARSDSPIGFFHFVEADGRTLSLQAWSTGTLAGMCTAEGKGRHYDIDEAGVWADCARQRRPVVHNDYAGLPDRKGMPVGHAPVVREMAFPIVRNEAIVAILGVGNKPQDYTEADLEHASELAEWAWDIVARKRAEEALEESNELLSQFVRHSPVHAYIKDVTPTESRVITASENLKDLVGFAGSEMEGRTLGDLFPAEVAAKLAADDWAVVSRGDVLRLEEDLNDRHYTTVKFPLAVRERRILAGYSIDITERKRAEDALRSFNEDLEVRVRERTAELEASNRELDAFSYSVSHDLRAPLRAIDGFAGILLEEHRSALAPAAQRYLDLVRGSAQQMGRLVDDLLDFSRLGRQSLRRKRVAPEAMVRECLDELASTRSGRDVGVAVAPLPDCRADPAMLRQVWFNLLDNAHKFTRSRDRAEIRVGYREADGVGAYFVADNGVGFDMDYVGKLFGVFERLHRAEEYEGTGVGLALVQRIVNRHGGRAWAEAEVGRGATFYFTLGEEVADES